MTSTRVPRSISQQHFDSLPAINRSNLLSLVERLEIYAEKMQPGLPVDARDGATNQRNLWTAIKWALERPADEFTLLYTELLMFVHVHRDSIFSERYIYRFFDHLSLGNGDRRNFERILNLVISTSNPATRRLVVQQLDIRQIMRDMRNEQLTEKVAAYYVL